jgi:hypothetical protein
MTRIALIANCQARPVATLVQRLAPQTEITGTSVVHLATPKDEAAMAEACATADVIFAQLVADNYPVSFVRTAALKAAYPGKVVVWPNLFFRGQCPDLHYATGEGRRRLEGPLAEYHSRTVLDGWSAGRPAADTLARLEAGDLTAPPDTAMDSLTHLRQREAATDVAASDLIAADWTRRRLFFTFNHPRTVLLEALTRRLLAVAGIAATGAVPPSFGEPLGPIVPPLTAGMRAAIGLDFGEEDEVIRGVPWPAEPGRRRAEYTLPDLVNAFYRAYDAQDEIARTARLS